MSTAVDWPVVIESKLPDVSVALPVGTIQAEQLRVAFMAAFNAKPDLRVCSQMSVCAALINCASIGLIPETPEQHAYLIPRGGVCTLQIGYRGFCHMMLRNGSVSMVDSDVIHEGDEYELQKGEPVICRFKPNLKDYLRRQKPVVAAYVLLVLADGNKKLEVMDASDLAKIKAAMLHQNKGKVSPAWREWESEMFRKAPLKRIAKTCNLGPVVAKAIELDNEQVKEADKHTTVKVGDETAELAGKLWELLAPVRGNAKPLSWDMANVWMKINNILEDEDNAPDLTPDQFKEAIARCEILKQEGTLK